MLIGFLYLTSFLVGVYLVWQFGRDEYYDEEKLIDLSLFSAGVALLTARIAYFFLSVGRRELITIQTLPSFWLGLMRFFQLNAGSVWWVGLFFFFLTASFLLWKWHWPFWPMLGILALGLSVFVILKEILMWYWYGLTGEGVVLAGAVLISSLMFYSLRLGGLEILSEFISGVKEGWKEKIRH